MGTARLINVKGTETLQSAAKRLAHIYCGPQARPTKLSLLPANYNGEKAPVAHPVAQGSAYCVGGETHIACR